MNSALYTGWLRHRRFSPKAHDFTYPIFMLLLDLDELALLKTVGIASRRAALASFQPDDYLDGGDLRQAALRRLTALTGETLHGKVYLLCQLRYCGFHFNPVNFYYCHDEAGQLRWLLAEVRNTPWNERHVYAIPADHPEPQAKCFHVSPFNPLEMDYHWQFTAPGASLRVHIENHHRIKSSLASDGTAASPLTTARPDHAKVLDATLQLRRVMLTRRSLYQHIRRLPMMTLKTALAIYWQALRLWLKKVPVYAHPSSKRKHHE
ncbi:MULTISPECIES: DUF1365 domain-containing protein [Dickeya]|uniref:Plasmid partition ParA protein n=1 Tax=Dickeya aquatica TaxID=1401087 RepID=A0A375AAJ8_9GAMM|nr:MULTISPECIES: DUF1365 domain-containing protein [Dickeya]SLM63065.1 Hypothetical protein COG3496 [Dickeya aquatica]